MAPSAETVTNYRRILDHKDITAVINTTPLYLHAEVVNNALQAGKHVFCEKLMAYSINEAKSMARTAQSCGRILQIGHQRRYSVLYNYAWHLIRNEKILGRITTARAQWNRNGSWRRPVSDKNLDPLLNWRLYSDRSQGLMAELASHQLHVVNWFLDATPIAVTGVGGIDYWQDGRDIFDNVHCIFEYPNGVKVSYEALTTNQFDGFYEQFMGDEGTIRLTSDKDEQGFLYREPKAQKLEWASAARRVKSGADAEAILLSASASRKLLSGAKVGQMQLHGRSSGKSDYQLEMEGFFNSIHNGEPVLCNWEDGLKACATIIIANQAMLEQKRLLYTPDMFTL